LDIIIEFSKRDQKLGALQEAAYRLIGDGSCQIQSTDEAYVCQLVPAGSRRQVAIDLRARFLDLVTDENLREKIAAQTEPTRNLILALAFGALVNEADQAGEV
jgi:His-Xaa-Ser system protein HxsD